jgi:hypothetical protein
VLGCMPRPDACARTRPSSPASRDPRTTREYNMTNSKHTRGRDSCGRVEIRDVTSSAEECFRWPRTSLFCSQTTDVNSYFAPSSMFASTN